MAKSSSTETTHIPDSEAMGERMIKARQSLNYAMDIYGDAWGDCPAESRGILLVLASIANSQLVIAENLINLRHDGIDTHKQNRE